MLRSPTACARLARLLASLHAEARRGPAVDAEGTRAALLGRWDSTSAQLRSFHGDPARILRHRSG